MTAIPVPWNGLAVPEASGVSGRDPVGRLRGPYQLAADLPAFVIRRVEVYVGPPGLQIGDLPVGQRCRPLDRARYAAAERHQDAGIGSGSGGTVDMAGCRGQPGIGYRPIQRLGGGVQRRCCGALGRRGDRRLLAGTAEIGLEVDLLGPRDPATQERRDNTQNQRRSMAHLLPPVTRYPATETS